MGLDMVCRLFLVIFPAVLPLDSDFLMNCGMIVIIQATAKITQLRQSMKLTGVMRARAAAAINPNTERRKVRMVRVK